MTFTALSVINPWPWLILRPDVLHPDERAALRESPARLKDVENRVDWETPFRGWALLHASKTRLAKWDWRAAILFAAKRGVDVPLVAMPYGAIVGAMRVDDCRRGYASPWAVPGANQFVIGAAVPFAEPVVCDGKPRFFRVDEGLKPEPALRLRAQLAAAVRAAGLAKCFNLEENA